VLAAGPRCLFLGYVPMILLASSMGVWLFYIQHQFEDTYWAAQADWDFRAAALQGSSFYDLPRILHWLTGYIGFHHIHHLSSKVPNYHLRACFEQNSEFWQVKCLTLLDSFRCPRLALWDEEHRRLVPFPGAAGQPSKPPFRYLAVYDDEKIVPRLEHLPEAAQFIAPRCD
jgi:acyl-lipid omega-6 desaturase (Delta-12 desaturase)